MDGNRCSIDVNRKIVEFIDSGRSFAVALIIKAEGSTPRKAGVKAIIDKTGKIWGTLGGGQVEAEAQRRAVEVCKSKHPVVFDMNLYGADRADDVPICGGSMRLLIDPTPAKNRASYAQVAEAVLQRQRGVMLTIVRSAEHTEVQSQWFPQEDIPLDAAFPGPDNIRSCLARERPQLFAENSQNPKVFTEVMVEPVIPRPLLIIAGGGHIGQALALAGSLVGFDITVIDDRPEFTDPAIFPEGTATRDGDIPKLITAQPIAGDTYIVLVTRGHKLDAESLEACIHTPAAYIGMIGSRRKVALIRKNFIESGLATEEEFDRVHAPVGLDIGAVTVPEIAASITAQLIAVRRKSNPDLSTDQKGLQ
ncbi:MAG: XdhC family protein [Planctomycetes bacterium]|nr:XdhC family protein [Planctomycetota bacterium]